MSELLDSLTEVAAEAFIIAEEKGVELQPVDALKAALIQRRERQLSRFPDPYRSMLREIYSGTGLQPDSLEASKDGQMLLAAMVEMTKFKAEHPF
jgi:hypothetical protein